MNKPKAVVFACLLLFVSVAVIASAVSEANQQLHEKPEAANANTVEESKQYCHHGCCRYYGHHCVKCCGSVAEALANANNNKKNDDDDDRDAATQKEREVEANQHRWRHGGGHRRGWGGDHGKSGGGN